MSCQSEKYSLQEVSNPKDAENAMSASAVCSQSAEVPSDKFEALSISHVSCESHTLSQRFACNRVVNN